MYAGRQAPPSGQFADAYESHDNLHAYHGQGTDAYTPYGQTAGPSYDYSEEKLGHQPTRSDYSLANDAQHNQLGLDDAADRDYGQPIPRGDKPMSRASMINRRTDRGSVAAQMAAAGEIPKKTGLRMWRNEEHKGSFTRGGRGRCFGRCCCCTIVIAILIVVGVIAGFLREVLPLSPAEVTRSNHSNDCETVWVRPPNVEFYGIDDPSVKTIDNGFDIDITINIGVQNPNFFGATFKKITATGYYPTNKSAELGGGTLEHLHIGANTNNTIHFPFNINYTTEIDPSGTILKDIATKCGIIKGGTGQLTVDYDLKLDLKLAAITVSPTISSSATFDCPLTSGDLSGLLDGILSKRDAAVSPRSDMLLLPDDQRLLLDSPASQSSTDPEEEEQQQEENS